MKQTIKNLLYPLLRAKPLSLIDVLGDNPLCHETMADEATYLSLWEKAKAKPLREEIKGVEERYGASLDKEWVDDLALHTQIVIKNSELDYSHGRVLYTVLSKYCQDGVAKMPLSIFETGTARGFSTICMAKAMADNNVMGTITTVDILPHNKKIYWNCIDDKDGKKSRRELLKPWDDYLRKIVFYQEETQIALQRLSFSRIHFAFLDASHTYEDVMREFLFVEQYQEGGDVIVFDDVTQAQFSGVVEAVREIEAKYPYVIEWIDVHSDRGYAIATCNK